MIYSKKAICVALACCCLSGTAFAQHVSLTMNNVTVKQAMDALKKQSGYSFVFSSEDVDTKKKISVDADNQEVGEVVRQILNGQSVTYEIKGKTIVVRSIDQVSAATQKKTVTGTIVDPSGMPVIGANVMVKGTTNGTITDMEGKFTLQVNKDAILVISYIGFGNQEVKVGNQKSLSIVLKEDAEALEELVVVGYGTQRKGNLTGSIAEVKSEKLTIAPISSVSNALAGVLPGLVVKQTSGLPGSDGSSLRIRGFDSPLVIVDGIESSFDNIDANQIESISILKDGSASIYGARAGNGVVLVTTKRGSNQKPTITVNSSFTLQGISKMTKPADSYQRALMEREEHIQSGQPESTAPWTTEDIEHFRIGDDPLRYPNTDWYDVVFRNFAPQQNHNISIRGGGDKVKYMGYFGYNDQETMVKKGGGKYQRYNLQSNMDASITDDLSMSVDINSAFEDRDFPIRGLYNGAHTWADLYSTKPWYPAELPDPTKVAWGGTDVGSVAATTNIDISGYNKSRIQDLKTSASLVYDFKKIIPGLKAKIFCNYIMIHAYYKNFQKPVLYYTYDYDDQSYTLAGSFNGSASLGESYSKNTTFTQQYSLMYDRLFKEKHHVSALALYELIDYHSNGLGAGRVNFITPLIDQMYAGSTEGMTTNGSESEMGRVSYVARLNYDYAGKYLIETILRVDASAKFAQNNRWGYFPSISLGWNIGEESWMKRLGYIDNLKLRASYGQSGNDAVGNFQYLNGYALGTYPYMFNGESVQLLYSTGLANPYLTWEKMKIYNLGLDYSLWSRKLYGTIEGFYRLRDGIPGTRISSLPSTFGASLPVENLNAISDRGFEFSLGTTGNFRELKYDLNGNISWSRAKWYKYDEPVYSDPDQDRLYRQTGVWTDRICGYVSDGLFTSEEEIKSLDYVYKDLGGNDNLKPGDIKYKDLNGDHVLDWRDQKEIAKGNMPHWMFGLNIGLQYKDFDFTGLFQGAFGYSTYIDALTFPTTLKFDQRWTQENNNPNAEVPRLGGAASNGWGSDYWYKNTAYVRLKNLSIGYNIPKVIIQKIGLQKVRIYFAGTNLVTFSSLDKYGVDPEVNSGAISRSYPQPRTYSFGINLSL